MGRFTGKTAVITGAGSGIGAATADRLAAEGASVVIADIAEERGCAVRDGVASRGGTALFVGLDVSSADQWARAVAATHDAFGPIDILHSNALTLVKAPLLETEQQQWDRQLAVNLTGLYLGAKAVLPDLIEQHGCIVATSSVHASFGLPAHPGYAASKGAICSLVRQLAVEYGPAVRVNAVVPGPIESGMWDLADTAALSAAADATALRRMGLPTEVAAAVAFLASSDASFITGTTLVVDGGWSVVKDSP